MSSQEFACNGTLVDEELLTDEQAGHCVSIREEDEPESKDGRQMFGICVLDSATSEFNLSAFEDDVCRTKLETMMRQLRPKEILVKKSVRYEELSRRCLRLSLSRDLAPCP